MINLGQSSDSVARRKSAFAGLMAVLLICGCVSHAETAGSMKEEEVRMPDASGGTTTGLITLTGTRATKGNAVDCPELRGDDGKLHPVKGLASDIAIGDRVTVTGRLGVSTSCRGEVLIIETLTRL